MGVEWKDISIFKKYNEKVNERTELIQKSLNKMLAEGKIIKEFDEKRKEWIYKNIDEPSVIGVQDESSNTIKVIKVREVKDNE